MYVEKTFSDKVRILSFVAAVLIVLGHSNAAAGGGVSEWNSAWHYFFGQQLACVATPFFFVVSGFWFARGFALTNANGGGFILKKLKTLGIPYLVFSIVALPFVIGMQCGWNYLHHVPIWVNTCFESGGEVRCLNRIFAIIGCERPYACGQLWYVRALLILFAFAPVWRWFYRHCAWILLTIFLIIVIFDPHGGFKGVFTMEYGRTAYFFLGMFLARFNIENWQFPVWLNAICICLTLLIFIGETLVRFFNVHECIALDCILSCKIPLAVLTFWFTYDWVVKKGACDRALPRWLNDAFIIYCLHGIFLIFTIQVPRYLFGTNDYFILALTPLSTLTTVVGIIYLTSALRRIAPAAMKIVSGGRSK